MEQVAFNASRTAAFQPSMAAPFTPLTLLEATIPGASLLTGFLSEYLHIDVQQYFGLILILGALTAGWQFVADRVWSYINLYFMSTAQIRYNDEVYNYLMFWISKNAMAKTTTSFVATTQIDSSQCYGSPDSDNEDEGEEEEDDDKELSNSDLAQQYRNDRMRPIRFTPSAGTHYFRYKGHWMTFNRNEEKEQGYWGSTKTDEISISCFGRNPQVLKDLLIDAQLEYLAKDGTKTIIYRGTRGWGGGSDDMDWVRCMSRPPRSMDTVVLDEGQKRAVLADMKEYLHPRTKRWYANRGIPYRRGYLLHGPPGTGKTSLCFALAGLLRLPIYVASLNSKNVSEEGLASLFRALPRRSLVMLEDIDAAGLITASRDGPKQDDSDEKNEDGENKNESQKPDGENKANGSTSETPAPETTTNKGISLSGFLNIIDGVASSEGRILVMTTNHIEKLDAALLRPGRVDMTIHFGLATAAVLRGIFMAIYSTADAHAGKLAEKSAEDSKDEKKRSSSPSGKEKGTVIVRRSANYHGKTEQEISEMADKFAESVPPNIFSPAEVQGYLLIHKRDPQAALDGAERFVTERQKEKEKEKAKK